MSTAERMAEQHSRMAALPVFILAHFTHHLCVGALIPLMPFIREAFGLSYFQSGLLVSAFGITSGFANLPMARLSERFGAERVLALGMAGVAVATFALGLSTGYLFLLAGLLVLGVLSGSYHAPAVTSLARVFPSRMLGRTLGTHLIGGSFSLLLTPLLAGTLAQAFGWRPAYMLLALPSLLLAPIFWRAVPSPEQDEASRRRTAAERLKLREMARLIGPLVAIATVNQMLFSGVNSFLPLYFVDQHGLSFAHAAMMVGLAAGAGIVGGPLGGFLSDRLGRKTVIAVSLIATGPLVYLFTIQPFGILLIGTVFLFGLMMTIKMPAMESLLLGTVPATQRSAIMGVYYFLSTEVGGLSAPLVGQIIDWAGINTAYTMLAALAFVSSLFVLLLRQKT